MIENQLSAESIESEMAPKDRLEALKLEHQKLIEASAEATAAFHALSKGFDKPKISDHPNEWLAVLQSELDVLKSYKNMLELERRVLREQASSESVKASPDMDVVNKINNKDIPAIEEAIQDLLAKISEKSGEVGQMKFDIQASAYRHKSANASSLVAAFAVLAVASSLLNVWFVSGGSQKIAMKNLPLTAQKSQAWNLDDGIAFCQDLKSTMASAREAMDNSTRLGYEIQYFDMAAAAYKDAYSSFYDNNCDAMSYMLE
jgi:predicted signal transduction protein with EAL and GGDEF domain